MCSLYLGNNLISGAMPNSANQSLSNLDSTGQDKFDAKVNKSGDTMTGSLTVSTADQDQIVLVEPQTTKGTNPSATYYTGIYFNDSQNLPQSSWKDTRLAFIEHGLTNTGVSTLSMGAVQNAANGAAASYSIRVDSSGNASCSFPNTTCCDGRFISVNTQIMSGVSLNGSSNLSYTLSNLPNDGHLYLVWFTGNITTGSTSGNYLSLSIYSDAIANNLQICAATTRTTSSVAAAGNIVIPVTSSRNIYVVRSTNNNGTANLWLKGYRRIGTNS